VIGSSQIIPLVKRQSKNTVGHPEITWNTTTAMLPYTKY